MKKLILVMLVMAGFCLPANAQLFVSGTLGLQYRNDTFRLNLLPGAGYEISDKFAVGMGVGLSMIDDEAYGHLTPYVRFNFWNNDKLFLDAKAGSDITLKKHYNSAFIGVKPSVRYAINDHMQLSADVGFFGVDVRKKSVKPALGVTLVGVDLTAIYKF